MIQSRLPFFIVILAFFGARTVAAGDLQKLRYNNPGLTVDLGVGLWAWPVPCDADGDGDYDLIVSCPDKPSNGIWMFENETGDTGVDPFPVFLPARKLSSTEHYVVPSYVQGRLRVMTPGYEYREFMRTGLQQRIPLPIKARFYKPIGSQPKGPKVRHNEWRYADYNGDGALDLIVGIEDWSDYGWDDAWNANGEWTNGPLHGFVIIFLNRGSNENPAYADPFKLQCGGQDLEVYGCPTPNFEDFDKDGDLDLLCGEFLDGLTYFQNTGTRTEPVYSAGRPIMTPTGTRLHMDLQMIVPIAFDWDHDADLDLIVGDEDGRVAFVRNTGLTDTRQCPVFEPPRYFQQQADTLKCGALATPFGCDWDGDGDTDLLSGNTAGYIEFFENLSGPGVEFPRWAAPVRLVTGDNRTPFRVMAGPNGSIQGPAEAKWGYSTLSVADWNHDGRADIIVNGIWGKVLFLENLGHELRRPRLADPVSIQVDWPDKPPKPRWTWWNPSGKDLVTQWRTTPSAIDWNQDGLTDLVMLDHEGYLAFYERKRVGNELRLSPPARLFFAEGFSGTNSRHSITNRKPGPLQLNSGIAGGSGRRKIGLADWDGDGLLDLLVNSSNANLLKQVHKDDAGWHFRDSGPLVTQNIQGHTTSPTVVDFNNDTIPDFVGGAEDGRFYYQRNPRSE